MILFEIISILICLDLIQTKRSEVIRKYHDRNNTINLNR